MNEIVRDGGMKSRKLWFAIFAITVIVGAAVVGPLVFAGFVSVYDAMVGGIVAIAGMYLTGNVAQKWVGVKAQPALMQAAALMPKPAAEPLADQPEEPAAPPAPRFTED